MSRVDKFTLALFGVMGVAIVVPALIFIVISLVSPGAIELGGGHSD